MMFYIFGAAVVLATFTLVNAAVSLAVMVLAPAIVAGVAGAGAATRTRVLLAVRLAPAVAAGVAALALVLPAYILFEPPNADEHVTWPLALLAGAAVAVVALGLLRGARALRSTAALERHWMAHAEPIAVPLASVPVYRVRESFPVFTVVGLRRPALYVSPCVLDTLAPAEIAAAVAHERGHLDERDNVKRLLLRACPDLVAYSPASGAIEQEWARAAEVRADERASRGGRETALALAAGLLKVARMVPMTAGGLPVSALHDGGDVEARVRHLVKGADGSVEPPARARAVVVLASAALGGSGVVLATQALPAVHELIEVAARLLR
jgi:beta-lactamase regulating signal transducer with metallopeptidase domain